MEHYRVCVLGDSGVGKTKMMEAYSGDGLSAPGLVNVFVTEEFGRTFEWWDFSGGLHYEALRRMLYTYFDGLLLVYDLSNCNSYRNLHKWFDEVSPFLSLPQSRTASPTDTPLLIVGNKADLAQEAIKYTFTATHTVACAATGAFDNDHWRLFIEEVVGSLRKADLIRANKLLESTIRDDIGLSSDSQLRKVWKWVVKKVKKRGELPLPR